MKRELVEDITGMFGSGNSLYNTFQIEEVKRYLVKLKEKLGEGMKDRDSFVIKPVHIINAVELH